MRQITLLAAILIGFTASVMAQPAATSAQAVEQALAQKQALHENSLVKKLPFKNIGPTVMSGRVVDFAVNPNDPTEFYVGYASGGVWHTKNNGTTFEPILDNSPTQNVGSLAVDWSSGTIWVGTGEVNASRSSYAGIGLLRSTNNGASWENMGLKDSHHISKILINPADPNEIVVGAVGHLYSRNSERGVYKSTDGGATWRQTLFVNDESGIIEMDVDRSNFDLMYASSWQKDRKAWNFTGSGDGSAIYKSTDGGDSWTRVTTQGSGFPTGEGVGRIGIAVVDANTVYAIHDNQFRRDGDEEQDDDSGLSKEDFKTMSKDEFLALGNKELNTFLRTNGFQEKYRAENVKQMVRGGTVQPADLARYLEDANTLLFDTPVIGAEVYKSTDGGKSWKKTHEDYLDGVYFSYGYYFGKIHVDPNDPMAIYIYGVPILASKDGGETFESIGGDNVHSDHHALWINPERSGHMINGNDGGVNITYDDGESWIKCNSPSVGQFYAINVDNQKPYNVYGGLQDNGVWVGPHTNEEGSRWHSSGQYPYESIMGGDGMQVQIDSRDPNIVYTGYQFGNYFRLNRATGDRKYIQPKHELGEAPYRFNWQTPVLLSSHNQDIVYFGGNKLMRSMNQGEDWDAISPDLTNGGKVGNVAYGTITTISESQFAFGTIYVGTDDGNVQLTRDGGGSWKLVSGSFPKDLWVSRVEASSHSESRVYVSLNGYRWDDFTPYVYRSDDYGTTWTNIGSSLPASPVNVIKEDPHNENIIYVGTDNGAYVSLDRGSSWQVFVEGLPNVAFHDLVVQPEANHLVLGTHGRSIYLGDVSLLQKMDGDKMDQVLVGELAGMRVSRRWGSSFSPFFDAFEPSMDVQYYVPAGDEAKVTILSEAGDELNSFSVDAAKGLNQMSYDLTVSKKGVKAMDKAGTKLKEADNGKTYLPKGKYTLKIEAGKASGSGTFELK
jgi:photosystem II stability/assembly factor-like uncharacterized protein